MPHVQLTFLDGNHHVLMRNYDDGRSADRQLVRLLKHGIYEYRWQFVNEAGVTSRRTITVKVK